MHMNFDVDTEEYYYHFNEKKESKVTIFIKYNSGFAELNLTFFLPNICDELSKILKQ